MVISKVSWICESHLGLVPDSLINDIVILNHLLLDGILQVLHASFHLLKVDVAQTTIEENLARIELEKKTQLSIVDQGVATKVEEGVVEVCQCFLKVGQKKVGDSLLEICNGEILIELDGALVALDLRL